MWVLFVWIFNSYDTRAITLTSQEFVTEKACRIAFSEIKKVNSDHLTLDHLTLRGACTPKGDE